MPVTVRPAPHGAREWSKQRAATVVDLLKRSCPVDYKAKFQSLEMSSFRASDFSNNQAAITPSSNGFVLAAIDAYSGHHHLIIRPEDVWFSILAQLNIYINGNAEELRQIFVAHEGKMELEVSDMEGRNFGKLAETMSYEIEKNIKDPSWREWVMPAFSTTLKEDTIVASIIMMGMLQKYFTYKFNIKCGIPSVTLLGKKEDWELIFSRLDGLSILGKQPQQWIQLLKPILKFFIQSFETPDSYSVKDFWQKIAHVSGGGSGPSYLSGWITAFCFWDKEGKCGYPKEGIPAQKADETTRHSTRTRHLNLDGVLYHYVDTGEIPLGYVSVPVKVDDNGHVYETCMIAGSVGMNVTSSKQILEDCDGHKTRFTGWDTLQPVCGWWMFKIKKEDETNASVIERERIHKR